MAELASLTRLRERLVIAGLLSRAADLLHDEGRASALAMAAHSTRPRVERTQVLRLGALAERTASVSTLLDYVQVQTGKRAEWRQEDFGPRLLRALADLQGRAESLAAEAHAQGVPIDDLARTLHLELARQFIRHFLAAYVAGPPAQGQPQRPGEGARVAASARGALPDRRQPPGLQPPAQARRPASRRPPRLEQPTAVPETTEHAPRPAPQDVAVADGSVPSSQDALADDQGSGEAVPPQSSAMEQEPAESAVSRSEPDSAEATRDNLPPATSGQQAHEIGSVASGMVSGGGDPTAPPVPPLGGEGSSPSPPHPREGPGGAVTAEGATEEQPDAEPR